MNNPIPTDGNGAISKTRSGVIAGAFVIGIVIGAGGLALLKGKEVDFVVPLPDGQEIKFKTQDGRLPFLDVFKTLFENEISTAATQGVLEKEYHIYDITSGNLAAAVQELAPDHKLSIRLKTMLKNGEGPFQQQANFFFKDIHSQSIVNDFDQQEANKYYDVVDVLRDRCLHRKGFCEDRGSSVHVALTDKVSKGEAAICWASQLLGSTAWIQGKLLGTSRIVDLDRFFNACGNPDTVILLNTDDGRALFGEAPPDAAIDATMYVSPAGYLPVLHKEPREIAADPSKSIAIGE